jgi:hypothetical protein
MGLAALNQMKTKPGMSQLNIEIPEELKRAIKVRAAMEGVTLFEWTTTALRAASEKAERGQLSSTARGFPADVRASAALQAAAPKTKRKSATGASTAPA